MIYEMLHFLNVMTWEVCCTRDFRLIEFDCHLENRYKLGFCSDTNTDLCLAFDYM